MALITTETNLDYLITALRLQINDAEEPYTFSDDFLRTHLVNAVKALMGRWNNKYLINNTTNYVERNPYIAFQFPEPPVVQHSDERSIVLQAAINLKRAYVYNSSQSAVSWKDDEVSYSNLGSIKAIRESLSDDMAELDLLLPTARTRLAQTRKQSLLGFDNPPNEFEG
jgi:hypothetical protein